MLVVALQPPGQGALPREEPGPAMAAFGSPEPRRRPGEPGSGGDADVGTPASGEPIRFDIGTPDSRTP
eukprot:14789466-Heterocapsa_arctica.AAC.1